MNSLEQYPKYLKWRNESSEMTERWFEVAKKTGIFVGLTSFGWIVEKARDMDPAIIGGTKGVIGIESAIMLGAYMMSVFHEARREKAEHAIPIIEDAAISYFESEISKNS